MQPRLAHRAPSRYLGLAVWLAMNLAACGDSEPGESSPDARPSGLDAGGSNGCICLAGGFDPRTGAGIVSRVNVERLIVWKDLFPVLGPTFVHAPLVIEGASGVVHWLDNSEHHSIEVHQPVRDAASYAPLDGQEDSPIYVALDARPEIRVLTEAAPDQPLAMRDLSSEDVDGDPDIVSISLIEEGVVVAMARLDEYGAPRGRGLIDLLDRDNLDVLESFETLGGRPSGPFGRFYGAILPTMDGDDPGCIQRLVMDSGPHRLECIVSNDDLGGYVTSLSGFQNFWAVVVSADGEAHVVMIRKEGDTLSVGPPVGRPGDVPASVKDCLRWVVYIDGKTGLLQIYDWRNEHWSTDEAGLSLGLPAFSPQEFACEIPL